MSMKTETLNQIKSNFNRCLIKISTLIYNLNQSKANSVLYFLLNLKMNNQLSLRKFSLGPLMFLQMKEPNFKKTAK